MALTPHTHFLHWGQPDPALAACESHLIKKKKKYRGIQGKREAQTQCICSHSLAWCYRVRNVCDLQVNMCLWRPRLPAACPRSVTEIDKGFTPFCYKYFTLLLSRVPTQCFRIFYFFLPSYGSAEGDADAGVSDSRGLGGLFVSVIYEPSIRYAIFCCLCYRCFYCGSESPRLIHTDKAGRQ